MVVVISALFSLAKLLPGGKCKIPLNIVLNVLTLIVGVLWGCGVQESGCHIRCFFRSCDNMVQNYDVIFPKISVRNLEPYH